MQLVPTSGSVSTSLWDTADPAALQAWLESAVAVDVTHTIHEVQEEFAVGLGDVQRARGVEAVAAAGRDVADRTGRAVHDVDARLRLTEKAKGAAEAVRESAVGKSTAAALTKAGSKVAETTTRVIESERVAAATEAVNEGFKRLGASFTRFVKQHQGGEQAPASSHEAVTVVCGWLGGGVENGLERRPWVDKIVSVKHACVPAHQISLFNKPLTHIPLFSRSPQPIGRPPVTEAPKQATFSLSEDTERSGP